MMKTYEEMMLRFVAKRKQNLSNFIILSNKCQDFFISLAKFSFLVFCYYAILKLVAVFNDFLANYDQYIEIGVSHFYQILQIFIFQIPIMLLEFVIDGFKTFFEFLISPIKKVIDGIVDFIKNLPEYIGKLISGAFF
jgi:hypothetical protein